MTARKLKILIASAEVAPFAKVGGLADVAGALPKALKAQGHDVRVVMPFYRMIADAASKGAWSIEELLSDVPIPLGAGHSSKAGLSCTSMPVSGSDPAGEGAPLYLVSGHPHFDRATDSARVYSLEPDPYLFFDRAIAELVPRLEPHWSPDVIHCNDWHTGLVPVFLETFHSSTPAWARSARIFTVHNLAHAGVFDRELLNEAGLPRSLFSVDHLEFYGQVSFMKGGLVYSDRANTVSPTYAEEIQTPEFGCGMDGLLRYLAAQGRVSGILNGIDTDVYNPETDTNLAAHYGAGHAAAKSRCRAALREECGLPKSRTAPIVGVISRLSDQKGFDLIDQAMEELLDLNVQLVILGAGERRYEMRFRELAERYPSQLSVRIGFDEPLARRIYSGCDLFLMPSRFEPCGLGQLLALRYGAIPVVRSTGGLADTILDADQHPRSGNGFAFDEYSAKAMMDAVRRALEVRRDTARWSTLVERALAADFSWERSAHRYVELYREAMSSGSARAAA